MKVYILSTYQEHGAEDVTATLDPSKLEGLLHGYPYEVKESELDRLRTVVAADEIGDHWLSAGWGGFTLHIIELDAALSPRT